MLTKLATHLLVLLRLICGGLCTLYKIGCIRKDGNNEHCYYEHRENLTWYESRELCVKMAMRLAQVDMPETQSHIETYMGKYGTNDAWIAGEVRKADDWHWINGKSVDSSIVLPPGNGDISQSACAAIMSMYNNTQLNNQTKLVYVGSPCSTRCHFICEFPVTDKCPPSSQDKVVESGICYRKYTANDTTEKTWFTARNFCKTEGGQLAVLPQNINMTSLNPLVVGISGQLWIGIDKARWKWIINGSYTEDMIFTSWSEGEPNVQTDGCIAIDPVTTGWKVRNCTRTKYQICEHIIPNL